MMEDKIDESSNFKVLESQDSRGRLIVLIMVNINNNNYYYYYIVT
jgi:hypothetical protein